MTTTAAVIPRAVAAIATGVRWAAGSGPRGGGQQSEGEPAPAAVGERALAVGGRTVAVGGVPGAQELASGSFGKPIAMATSTQNTPTSSQPQVIATGPP